MRLIVLLTCCGLISHEGFSSEMMQAHHWINFTSSKICYWFTNFQCDRLVTIAAYDHNSNFHCVNDCVPSHSVIAHVLFVLPINSFTHSHVDDSILHNSYHPLYEPATNNLTEPQSQVYFFLCSVTPHRGSHDTVRQGARLDRKRKWG